MSLKNTLRSRICRFQLTPNYPVGEFVQWAFGLGVGRTQLLRELDQLQQQLDTEAEALRQHSQDQPLLIAQQEYWCFYCAQVRAHYRMLLKQISNLH